MAVPTRTSYTSQTSSGTTNSVNVSSVVDGSWMLAVFEVGATSVLTDVTPPSGWTRLLPVAAVQTFGSRTFSIWGRTKQAGDSTCTWTLSVAYTSRLVLMWGTGADVVANWHAGQVGVRNVGNSIAGQSSQAGTDTTTVAPAVATSVDDSLVLALNAEATIATESGVSGYTGGTEWFWTPTDATYIESLHVLYNEQVTPGTVGDVTTTYPNPNANNGAGVQIVIPPVGVHYGTPSVAGTVSETVFDLTGTGARTYSVNMPTGITVDDYIMVCMRLQSSNIVTHPTLSGFDLVGRTQSTPTSSSNRYNAIFAKKIITAGDIPSTTVTATINQSATGSNRVIAEAFRLTNVDLVNPVVSVASVSSASSGTLTRPSYTSIVNALDIFYGASEFSASNDHMLLSYPSGYTSILSSGGLNPVGGTTSVSRTYLYLGSRPVDNATIPAAAISWSTTSGADAEGISIRGKSQVLPPGIELKNGTGAPVYLTYLDQSETRQSPTSVKVWYPGYPSVTALLNDIARHPTMAHRGGSANYPEFSEYGYDRAVMNGFGVLEFSCGWTSDNVPFGLGAQYLDGAAGLTPGTNLNPTTITWSALSSTYQNKINPVSPGVFQPFYRLQDFLAKYTQTHVVLIDPKFGFATSTKVNIMLNLCDTYGGPSRIIIKFDSPTTDPVLYTAAHARGYQCMNYWGTDLSSLTAQHANWDILGYAYNASPSDWSAILALGKPTWAAVIPSAADVATAVSSGAGLMMVRDVVTISPVSYWNA